MRSKPAVLWVVALILFVSPLPAQEPSEQLSLIEALRSASAAGEHEEVVELASRIVTVNPDHVEAWYLLGRHAEPLGRNELVIASSKRAWDHGYHFMPYIAVRIARAAAALDERELAYEWLRKALEAGLENRQEIASAPGFEKYLDDPEFRAIAATHGDQQRVPGLRRDIDLLVEEAQRLHAHPDRPAFDSEFLDAAEALKRRIEDLDDAEVVDELRRLTAILGDGHTVTYGAGEGSPLEIDSARLPVRFYLFDEGMFVIESYDPGTDWLVGSRVVAVGTKSPGELLDASRELHGSDNAMTMMWMGPQFYFSDTSFLSFADAIDDPSAVVLSVERPDGEIEKVVVEPGDHPLIRKLRASTAIEAEVPLYLRNVDRNYWLQTLPEYSALYFQFNQVRDDEEESIEELAGRLRAVLSDGVANLIVDVRHNNGGNNGLLRPLLREIIAFDARPGTRVFVITGRNTFSAAQNFINRVERMTDAVFVGEPSSSSPNFTGEETVLVLPWSRVMVSISSNYWQDSDPGDERPWIAPHISIPRSASDYFAGRDSALEAILKLIGKRENE